MGLLPIDDDENAMRSATLPSRDREGAVALPLRINRFHRVLKGVPMAQRAIDDDEAAVAAGEKWGLEGVKQTVFGVSAFAVSRLIGKPHELNVKSGG